MKRLRDGGSDRDHQWTWRVVWQWQKVLRMAHMVGASVGHPGRQTGGLSVHLELGADRTLRQGCSGRPPASHTHTHTHASFMLLSIRCNLFTATDSDRQCSGESEISPRDKTCVLSSLQATGESTGSSDSSNYLMHAICILSWAPPCRGLFRIILC